MRKTGLCAKENVHKDSDNLENVDDFFESDDEINSTVTTDCGSDVGEDTELNYGSPHTPPKSN